MNTRAAHESLSERVRAAIASAGPQYTKSDWVVGVLRGAIISGQLRPGQRLLVAELAELLHISATPVREALTQLKAEGLVITEPHRGARVAESPLRNIEELVIIRITLEMLAARHAMRRVTAEIIAELESTLVDGNQAVAQRDGQRVTEANRAFHLTLYQAADMPTLVELIKLIYSRITWGVVDDISKYPRGSTVAHQEVVDALKQGKWRQALKLMEAHLQNSARALRDTLAQQLQSNQDASLAPNGLYVLEGGPVAVNSQKRR
jgi:DNA-binding GntR family transcriptional regulator